MCHFLLLAYLELLVFIYISEDELIFQTEHMFYTRATELFSFFTFKHLLVQKKEGIAAQHSATSMYSGTHMPIHERQGIAAKQIARRRLEHETSGC
jgi:hypothetical protein